MIAVLDTGALSALSPSNERGRARLRALRQRVDDIELPAVVLAEGVLTGHPGHDFHLRRLLELVAVIEVDQELATWAGHLRTAALAEGGRPGPSAVDATVAALADSRAAREDVRIVTGDRADIIQLAHHGTNADRVTVARV